MLMHMHGAHNDASGVLIVYIPMHDRLVESAVETIATLHRKFGKEIWRYSVIALTKADQYPREDWLTGSKKWSEDGVWHNIST